MNATPKTLSEGIHNWKRIGIFGVLIGTMAIVGLHSASAGQHDQKHSAGQPGMRLFRLLEDLQLTEAQEVELVRIRRRLKEEVKQIRKGAHSGLTTLTAELEKPKPDPAAFHREVDQKMAAMTVLANKAVDEFLGFHSRLTPEQKTKLAMRAKQLAEHHAKNGERGPL
jgi:Spy/CpxP family protein refolding chaperone